MTDDLLAAASAAADAAASPEEAMLGAMAVLHAGAGDRGAHLREGVLLPGQTQFFVAGSFLATPDGRFLMLVGNTGFPPEQRRLCVPIDGGDPGRVIASGAPLLIADTRSHAGFRQYLKTARMGSAAYVPLLREGRVFGLIIVAALAGGTLGQADLDVLTALAPRLAARWDALGGPAWVGEEYRHAVETGEAFFAAREGTA
jgi:GAF domain-containing protein